MLWTESVVPLSTMSCILNGKCTYIIAYPLSQFAFVDLISIGMGKRTRSGDLLHGFLQQPCRLLS